MLFCFLFDCLGLGYFNVFGCFVFFLQAPTDKVGLSMKRWERHPLLSSIWGQAQSKTNPLELEHRSQHPLHQVGTPHMRWWMAGTYSSLTALWSLLYIPLQPLWRLKKALWLRTPRKHKKGSVWLRLHKSWGNNSTPCPYGTCLARGTLGKAATKTSAQMLLLPRNTTALAMDKNPTKEWVRKHVTWIYYGFESRWTWSLHNKRLRSQTAPSWSPWTR